jgi:Sulfotransferase family
MRVPDFFIVGTPKTGTTALHAMLRRHPQIYMPKLKEPRFLAGDMTPHSRHADGPHELAYPKTLAEYLALFDKAKPQQRAGEATPIYLWSRLAADSIADLQPDARIIAILREPASFLRSLHLAFLNGGNEGERDLRTAIELQAARRQGQHIPRNSHRPQLLQYSEHVRYVEQLKRYHARFPAEQVLVLIYDDFRADNEATVRSVLRFLEVDEQSPIDYGKTNVTSHSPRSPQAKHAMLSLSRGQRPLARTAKATLKTITTVGMREAAGRMLDRQMRAEAPPPDESFMLELRRRFKPQVLGLSEYLDRDLVRLWGYDEVN